LMKKPVKVAHIATIYRSIVTILDSKLRALDKFEDLDVTAISSPLEPSLSADSYKIRKPAVRFIPVAMSRTIEPLADLKSIWQLYKVFRREKFSVVHSHTAKAGFITAVAAKLARVPLICHTCHGLPFFEGQDRKSYLFYRFLEKIACKFRDHLFSQNKRDMAECIKLMGSEDQVSYEGNGVDIEFVRQSAENQSDQAVKDYPGDGLRLVLLSRLEPVKRIDDFFKVADKLRKGGLKVSCVVAGTDVFGEQLKNQLVAMHLEDCVNMVGFSDRPHGLIAASDIVMLCSEKEGIPRSIMEAMALTKPVVATNVMGTQELVVDGQTGFLVPLGDTDAMVEKVKLLAEDSSLRDKMGSYGLKRIADEFNDIKIAESLHRFYKLKTSKP
jgi:glycosyltransferase involved in cell wall biosynthesis